jgi:hypothetical protein
MLGASELLLEMLGASLDRATHELHEQTLALVRAELSNELLAAHVEEGRTLTLDQVKRHGIPGERKLTRTGNVRADVRSFVG